MITLPGIGQIEPDGSAYTVTQPVTVRQIRELTRDRDTLKVTLTSRDGVPLFLATVTVDGREISVSGQVAF